MMYKKIYSFLKNNKFNSGLTLIEIMIYVVLLTTIVGMITTFFFQVTNFKAISQLESNLIQNSQLVLKKLTADVKKSQTVAFPINENYVNSLVLQTEAGQVSYQVNGGFLQRNGQSLTDDRVVVSLDPPSLGFRRIGNSIQLRMMLTSKQRAFGQENKVKIYQTAVSLVE